MAGSDSCQAPQLQQALYSPKKSDMIIKKKRITYLIFTTTNKDKNDSHFKKDETEAQEGPVSNLSKVAVR